MEWEKQPPRSAEEPSGGGGGGLGGGVFVKVMTDEQMEVLRKQIAVYATICEQLVELHKSLTSQNDLAGMRLGNLYCDPLISSGVHKMSGRQRWTPTPTQLQILERIFDQGIGTPSKQKIKDITTELSQHGQISETNVYNWFQNRRARSKRKQQAATPAGANNNGESEVETEEVGSPNEKSTKPEEEFQPQQHSLSSRSSEDQLCFQNPQPVPVVDPNPNKSHAPLMPKFGNDLGQMTFYGGMDQIMGKIQVPGNYNPICNKMTSTWRDDILTYLICVVFLLWTSTLCVCVVCQVLRFSSSSNGFGQNFEAMIIRPTPDFRGKKYILPMMCKPFAT